MAPSRAFTRPPQPGERVDAPHPLYIGQREGATYLGRAPDHVAGPYGQGATARISQGRVRYDDGTVRDVPLDSLQPLS